METLDDFMEQIGGGVESERVSVAAHASLRVRIQSTRPYSEAEGSAIVASLEKVRTQRSCSGRVGIVRHRAPRRGHVGSRQPNVIAAAPLRVWSAGVRRPIIRSPHGRQAPPRASSRRPPVQSRGSSTSRVDAASQCPRAVRAVVVPLQHTSGRAHAFSRWWKLRAAHVFEPAARRRKYTSLVVAARAPLAALEQRRH